MYPDGRGGDPPASGTHPDPDRESFPERGGNGQICPPNGPGTQGNGRMYPAEPPGYFPQRGSRPRPSAGGPGASAYSPWPRRTLRPRAARRAAFRRRSSKRWARWLTRHMRLSRRGRGVELGRRRPDTGGTLARGSSTSACPTRHGVTGVTVLESPRPPRSAAAGPLKADSELEHQSDGSGRRHPRSPSEAAQKPLWSHFRTAAIPVGTRHLSLQYINTRVHRYLYIYMTIWLQSDTRCNTFVTIHVTAPPPLRVTWRSGNRGLQGPFPALSSGFPF